MLSPEEGRSRILLGLRKDDIQSRFNAYRILNWMLSQGLSVQIYHIDDKPYYLLKGMNDFIKLVDALDKDSKGRLVKPDLSVAVQHYQNPLDEVG